MGRVLGGRYSLIRELGRGGMGVVFEAIQLDSGRAVAVKVLVPGNDPDPTLRQRFQREARAAARIAHRNVVEILDIGMWDDTVFFVMELLRGESLSALLKQRQRLSLELTRQILLQVLEALHVAHAHGLVHRDLKPDNIFVDQSPEGLLVKVLDFGIAKDAEQSKLTETGVILGTPAYIAPEQALGLVVDARCDLYAVGVLAFECLAGTRPFRGKNPMAVITMHLHQVPPRLRDAAPSEAFSERVEAFVMKAMAKDVGHRFQSALEMASRLNALGEAAQRSLIASSQVWAALVVMSFVVTVGTVSALLLWY